MFEIRDFGKDAEMKRAFVTGAGGMVGSHLAERLALQAEVVGTSFRNTVPVEEIQGTVRLIEMDVRNWQAMRDFIADYQPEVIYHLAAQSLPTVSWTDPWDTLDTNVQGTINVFEAVREVKKTGNTNYDPMIVVACSSAEYGASMVPERVPINEETPLLPLHPYGVSKVAQDLLSFQYWRNYGIRCIRARIFNTTGPRKQNDVVSDFAARAARIVHYGGKLRVGNLKTRRAIMDVDDLISALVLLAEHGEPGEAYNICANETHEVGELIPILEKLAGQPLEIEQDPALLRCSDEAVIFGSNDKLRARTGWCATVSLEETVRRVFDYSLEHVRG